jgi:hypothetical protein
MKGPALMENGVFDVEPYEANTLTDAVFSEVTLSGAGTAVASVAVPLGLTYLIAVEGTEIPTNGLASRTLIVKRDNPSTSGVLYRVNAGGPALAAGDGGPTWSGDTSGTPSPYWLSGSANTFTTTDAVDLSDPSVPTAAVEALFQTYRFDVAGGAEMTYGFPVGSGQSYEVDLYFAETFFAANGARVFDIFVEGALINDFDAHAIVGADVGYVVTVETPVITDDELTIQFSRQVQNPMINAIEVRNSTGAGSPPSLAPIADVTIAEGGALTIPLSVVATGGDPVALLVSQTPSAPAVVTLDALASELVVAPPVGSAGIYTVSVTATDADGSTVRSFTVDVLEASVSPGAVIHRVNAGGPTVASIDGGPNWSADTLNPTWYGLGTKVSTIVFEGRDASVPLSAPQTLFHTHRYGDGGPMSWNIPVPTGELIEVRLYFGDGFAGTSDPGERVFSVAIDGMNAFGSIDLALDPGAQIGTMKSFTLVSDGNLDLDFTSTVQNPLINAIEIVSAQSQPSTLSAAPSSLDFGVVAVGSSASQMLTLRNLGGVGDPTIQVTGVALSGTGAGSLSTDFSGPVTLPPGGSAVVEVTLDPSAVGLIDAQISITHNGTNSPLVVPVDAQVASNVPVAFSKKTVVNGLTNITTLDWGPDGRLYTAQQDGTIKVFAIARANNGTYSATATETINLVKNLPNRTDLGLPRAATDRLVTGLVTAGTPSNPVIYVASSDPRIAVNDDTGETDTNSGILSRLTWTGSSWTHDQLIRGLPRSEENHATNGLIISGTKLFVAQGGHTNMGAPSSNFGDTPEFALSAAILEIDLTHPQLASGQYDLPTLNDPDRAGVNDANDPFGGNDGKNMAIWDPAGPVQVYSGGWRNIYDLVIADSGKMYTIDNGPNAGWGGVPLLDNPADDSSCTNDKNDGGLSLQDNLHYVTGEGYYGGHPNPVRGNASNFPGAVPVGLIDPQECVYLTPGVDDGALATFPFSTNGLAEYTASNFGGAMQGDLLAANFKGTVKRIQLNGSGTGVLANGITDLATSIPNALDVVAQGDDDPFPGTVWVASYGADSLVVLEPSDYDAGGGSPSCTGVYSISIDEDEDGYSNADEIDNGTNPCSAASVPPDFDGNGVSDLNDPDDDKDGLPDFGSLQTVDPFPLDASNGDGQSAFDLQFDPGVFPGTIEGLGFTGLMANGTDWLDLYDPTAMTAGGAASVLGLDAVPDGDAYLGVNSQKYAFQRGLDPTGVTTVRTQIASPWPDGVTPVNFQSQGIFFGTGRQDDYVKIVVNSNAGNGGVQFLSEVAGAVGTNQVVTDAGVTGTGTFIDLFLVIDPVANTVSGSYSLDGGITVVPVGSTTVPSSWFDTTDGVAPAAGVLATSTGPGSPFPAVWLYLSAAAGNATAP